MEAKIEFKTNDIILIGWSEPSLGFGQLRMVWKKDKQIFELDSELMGIDTVLKIFKAVKNENTKNNN